MTEPIIGYVSTPFGKKRKTNFDELYSDGIEKALSIRLFERQIFLFREDLDTPPWSESHRARLKNYPFKSDKHDPQLIESIHENIVMSDFMIAVLSNQNPNVMLEVGFAHGIKKPIIYVISADQYRTNKKPSNLGACKRIVLYEGLKNLPYRIADQILRLINELEGMEIDELKKGGASLSYFGNRKVIDLESKMKNANREVRILTTNLTTVSADYIHAIKEAVRDRNITVKILTSDPENEFIKPRANQLDEDYEGYTKELEGSFVAVSHQLAGIPNCEVRTYDDFPVQLWHMIDDVIYVGQSSNRRRTRYNCVFSVSTDAPNVKETYLDHFDHLWGPDKL